MSTKIETRTEHMTLQCDSGRFKASIQPFGPLSADPEVVWGSTNRITVYDLEKNCEAISPPLEGPYNVQVIRFFESRGETYLLLADRAGGYGVVDCVNKGQIHWHPNKDKTPWCWHSIVGVEDNGMTLTLTVTGAVGNEEATIRQYTTHNPMLVPYVRIDLGFSEEDDDV